MNIGVFGASGNIGQRIVAEARGRAHHVTALTRHLSHAREAREGVTWKVADILDTQSIAGVLGGLDVLVGCYQPGNASRDLADTLHRSISDPGCYARAAEAVLTALEATRPSLRVIVVGGAGSLEVKPGLQRLSSTRRRVAGTCSPPVDELPHRVRERHLDVLGAGREHAPGPELGVGDRLPRREPVPG